MVLNSYSKINLSLLVNSKQKNGLHNIQSFFCLIDLKDRIKIKKINNKKDRIYFKGKFAKLVSKKNNSIKSLLALLRRLNLISSYYSIAINKKIPVFAGLGGGTSNAVCVMKHILKKKISYRNLNILREKIGTDFDLFFYKKGFLKSLNSIINMEINQKLFFVLIKPSIKCSTREVYSKVRRYSKKIIFAKNKINKKNEFLNLISNGRNDLQSVVEKKYPRLKKILTSISTQNGCYFSRMTGSGSVCYGLFADRNSAKKAFTKLKVKYPKFWISLAKTI